MATLPTLHPDGQVTAGGWFREDDTTQTNLHLDIDDTGVGDLVNIKTLFDTAAAVGRWDVEATPSDFDTMNSLDIEIRHARGGVELGDAGGGDDTYTLFAQVVDSTNTALTDEMTIETGTIGYLVKTETVSFTGVVAGSKTLWDGARLSLRVTFTKNKGSDGDAIWVDFARLINGDYNVAAAAANPPFHRRQNTLLKM